MKLKPAQWTHHHTHRLYHLSMGLVFSFVALTVLAGLIASRSRVQADSISATSDDTLVSATVPEIVPGPFGTGICLSVCPPSAAPAQPAPIPGSQTITIVPEPRGQVPLKPFTRDGRRVFLYAFPTKYPAFSGQTSIANALIFININANPPLHSTTRADSSGNWFWRSPIALANSFYTVSVVARDPGNSAGGAGAAAALDFAVEAPASLQQPPSPGAPGQPGGSVPVPGGVPPSPGSGPVSSRSGPLSIFLEIPGNYKIINPGEKTLANIEIVNNDPNRQPGPQDIEYTIENAEHETVLRATDTVTLDKSVNFSKTFVTHPQARAGEYTVIGKIENKTATAAASDTFAIRQLPHAVPVVSSVRSFIDWIQILGIIILILFARIAASAYHKAALISRAIRHEQEMAGILPPPPPSVSKNS